MENFSHKTTQLAAFSAKVAASTKVTTSSAKVAALLFAFRKPLLALLLFCISSVAMAQVQDQKLAQEYYKQGDYEKAAVLYEKLYKDQPQSSYYFKYYYNCLVALQDYETLEKTLKKHIKKFPQKLQHRVDLGYMYAKMGEEGKAEQMYKEAIEDLQAQRVQVVQLSNAFSAINEFENAIAVFEKGRVLLAGQHSFNNELANLYFKKGNIPETIRAYLDYLAEDARHAEGIQTAMQRVLDEEDDFAELQGQLYQRIQDSPNDARYPELLIWNFVQLKDFEQAFIQVKALDKRFRESGGRVYNFGLSAQTEKSYDASIEAFEYIVEKGPSNSYYFNARNALVTVRKEKMLSGAAFDEEELLKLKNEYTSFLNDYARQDARAAATERELASLETFFLFDVNSAITRLSSVMEWPALKARQKSEIKLDLGDYYLIKGEVWESSLLYSQVDKAMKDEPLGEEARFKNARLSYYNGDFDWAQAQLNVLKASTSELVANDALDLSVFISENLGLDTSTDAMQIYARADLLCFQNRQADALIALDSLKEGFPGHMLEDDILYQRATIAMTNREWEKAVELLTNIHTNYSYDILGDNAAFTLAEIYERWLDNPEKAMELYQDIMLNFKDSIFVVEARKRFRALRGDELN